MDTDKVTIMVTNADATVC